MKVFFENGVLQLKESFGAPPIYSTTEQGVELHILCQHGASSAPYTKHMIESVRHVMPGHYNYSTPDCVAVLDKLKKCGFVLSPVPKTT